MEKNFVTVKFQGATIQCKPEDVAKIMGSLVGKGQESAKKVYEKSSVTHKAIRAIKAATPEEFTLACLANREGLHTVFSGYNDEIRTRFGVDPVDVTEKMITDGLIHGRPAPKGYWLTK